MLKTELPEDVRIVDVFSDSGTLRLKDRMEGMRTIRVVLYSESFDVVPVGQEAPRQELVYERKRKEEQSGE